MENTYAIKSSKKSRYKILYILKKSNNTGKKYIKILRVFNSGAGKTIGTIFLLSTLLFL